MSRSRLGKKLKPAAKALKRFTNSLSSKLQNFDIHRTIKVIKSNTNRFISYCSNHLFVPFKKRFLTKPPHPHYQYYRHYYQSYSRKNLLPNSSPIYIDKLYQAEQAGTSNTSSSRGKQVVVSHEKKVAAKRDGKTEKEKILYSIEDAWEEAVAKSPQLRPVDERAEEFIYNFRQDMQLQKERSNLEFQEMSGRSS